MAKCKIPEIVTLQCPRCSKPVASRAKAIISETVRKKYQGICGDCITSEEEQEILKLQGEALITKYSKE